VTILRRKGFTLIELLVVIAIIAILAAMLFPVFARARESARKIQCLSNVKNIAIAFQMYLTDYDKLPPKEHRPEVLAYFDSGPGSGKPMNNCFRSYYGNPYLRWPVILDEYVKNRDVWRCPSANMSNYATWVVGNPDWFHYLMATQGSWGRVGADCSGGPCCSAWPSGWGGSVTDSITQKTKSGASTNSFEQGVGITAFANCELKMSQVEDPSWFVVCGDAGAVDIHMPTLLAFPDMCKTDCGSTDVGCCSADWVNCSSTTTCALDHQLKLTIFSDATVGNRYTRHLGGSNIGFADGHAVWMPAYSIISESPHSGDADWTNRHLRGIGCTRLAPPSKIKCWG